MSSVDAGAGTPPRGHTRAFPAHAALQPGEFLSPAEIKDLTGEAKQAAQVTVLESERIPHRVVGKRVIVSRYHAREWLAGRLVPATKGGVNLSLVK